MTSITKNTITQVYKKTKNSKGATIALFNKNKEKCKIKMYNDIGDYSILLLDDFDIGGYDVCLVNLNSYVDKIKIISDKNIDADAYENEQAKYKIENYKIVKEIIVDVEAAKKPATPTVDYDVTLQNQIIITIHGTNFGKDSGGFEFNKSSSTLHFENYTKTKNSGEETDTYNIDDDDNPPEIVQKISGKITNTEGTESDWGEVGETMFAPRVYNFNALHFHFEAGTTFNHGMGTVTDEGKPAFHFDTVRQNIRFNRITDCTIALVFKFSNTQNGQSGYDTRFFLNDNNDYAFHPSIENDGKLFYQTFYNNNVPNKSPIYHNGRWYNMVDVPLVPGYQILIVKLNNGDGGTIKYISRLGGPDRSIGRRGFIGYVREFLIWNNFSNDHFTFLFGKYLSKKWDINIV